jgi:hypothetical protein
MAMTICGYFNIDDSTAKTQKANSEKTALGLADLVTLFMEMINTYTALNENTEASKLMQVILISEIKICSNLIYSR